MHPLWIALDEEGIHLLSSSDNKFVLEVVGGMLHHGEVEHRASEQDDHHGVGKGQDELRRKLTGGAG